MESFQTWFLIPLLIFFARILDVSIGTFRIISVTRGHKYLAGALGFAEIIVWLLAIQQIISSPGNMMTYIAFAGGFAAGNIVGILLEEKLAFGSVVIRVIVNHNTDQLIEDLRKHNFMVTDLDGRGAEGNVKVIFTVAKRERMPAAVELIKKHTPKAFYSIEDVRSISDPNVPMTPFSWNRLLFRGNKKGT